MNSNIAFFKSVLQPVENSEVLRTVYPQRIADQMTLEERLPGGKCEDCRGTEWIILPADSAIVRESGKPYIECKGCGYHTHL